MATLTREQPGDSAAATFVLLVLGATSLLAQEGRLFLTGQPSILVAAWVGSALVLSAVTGRAAAYGVPLGFWAPFTAILAVACGPVPAVMGEIACRLIHRSASTRPLKPTVALTIACGLGSAGLGAWLLEVVRVPGSMALAAVFLLGWLSADALAALWEMRRPAATSSQSAEWRSAIWQLPWLFVGWLAVAAGLGLIEAGHGGWAPLLLLPGLALVAHERARSKLQDQYLGTIGALSQMLQRAHPYTAEHVGRVSRLAERTSRELGMSPRHAELVREAAVLHDIGKIAVDERILDKPEPLEPHERVAVQRHSAFGAEILSQGEEFAQMAKWIRSHHERPDGKGYPDGLLDGEIPVESKIIAVADAYDAMTSSGDLASQRAYREPISEEDALCELERGSGTQFDAAVVQAFRRAVKEASR